ncbi:MAG: IPT/TIG domain-containing protein [Acidobacteriota bacterium]|nr:IPT/TIG domain-containing protein [Acidobacteriota bacterium]
MRPFVFGLSLLIGISVQAQSVREIVPAAAPRGARVLVSGTQLDLPGVAVSFAGSGGTRVAATVESRNAKFVEVTVPAGATSGNVSVVNGIVQIANLAFTVAPDVAWQRVVTQSTAVKQPQGVVVDPNTGNVYIADTNNHQIKVLSPAGTLTIVAGRGQPGFKDGTGTAAELKEPRALAFDAKRNVLYVADSGNNVIRRITTAGVVTTLAGDGKPADTDGTGSGASFKRPCGVAIDEQGNVYVADTDNHKIRKVTPSGVVTTFAGTGGVGYAEGGAGAARFAGPQGVAVAGGVVYVADTGNHRIRKIENGTVTLVAGDGRNGAVDGVAEQARFDRPGAVVIDEAKTLFVTDTFNGLVRKIAQGTVTTIAGRTTEPRNALNDGPPLGANLHQPSAIAFAGALLIADTMNDAVRLLEPELRLTDIHPRRGSIGGGNEVRIFGAGFVPGKTEVKVGNVAATNVTFVSSTLLIVNMPPGAGGATDITVSRFGDRRTLTAVYNYLPPPTIVSIAPAKGKTSGGQSALVRGTDFMQDETEVFFGTAAAPQVIVDNPTSATVTTPAGAAGVVDLLARTPAGEARLSNAFRFFEPPVLSGFAPSSGYPGTPVVISGNNFDTEASGNVVRFGALTARAVSATATNISTVVPAGATTGRISITTAGGTATSATDFVVPVLTILTIAPSSIVLQDDQTRQLTATGRWSDGSSRDVTSLVTSVSASPSVAAVNASGLVRAESAGNATITATLEGVTASANVKVEEQETLPPPSVEAPPLSQIEVTPISDAIKFLYSGPDAVQTGMAANALDPMQTSVVRGKVTTRSGAPLTGVDVAILGAPQYGRTKTRVDGWFDMAVNGGSMTITYQKEGYLPAHRTVSAPWRDYLVAPDVVMIPLDSATTIVQARSAAPQVARGSVAEDEDGRRQATLIFPADTGVTIVMPDGSTRSLQSLTVRATEYTIGASGPAAMPAALPPTSGYTYCVELSADEAIAAGATDVRFDKPVPLYVENFIGFPVGGIVPVGYLDRQTGNWVASENGRVVKVLDVSGTLAMLDINGDGAADDAAALAALGINDAERQRLTSLYAAGTSLWRVPIGHFTPWDCNWPYGPPLGASGPDVPPPTPAYWIRGGRSECGSIIDCHNQSLGEALSIPGVSFPLVYNTSRIASDDKRTLTVQVSGPNAPATAKRFELQIEYGGRRIVKTYPVAPSVKDEIPLDLRDAYGRKLTGGVQAHVSLRYVYDAVYLRPADFERSFGAVSGVPLSVDRSAMEISLSRTTDVSLSSGAVNPLGAQGWSIGNHNVYDFGEQTLHEGSGAKRTSLTTDPRTHVLRTIAGTGQCCSSPVNGVARELKTEALYFAVAPNGDVYLNEWDQIRKVDRNGNMTMVAGTGSSSGVFGEGPALQRRISPDELAVAPDGTLYFSDFDRIYRVRNGMIESVAGGGAPTLPKFGDGGPARSAYIRPRAFAVGPDSSVYIVDSSLSSTKKTIRRISPDGIIQTLYGGGTDTRNDIPAVQAELPTYGIVVGPDGTLYLVDSNHARIRKIGSDGIVRLVAGRTDCPFNASTSGDGGPAALACMDDPFDVAVDRNGVVYIAEYNGGHIRMVTPDGIITSAAGNGVENWVAVEGGTATGTPVTWPWNVEIDAEGYVYYTEDGGNRVRRIEPVLPKFTVGERFIASESGGDLYVFNGSRHLRTVDPLTHATQYAFSYDEAGRVSGVTDAGGGVTTFERDGSGKLTAVVAPTGQRTAVEMNAAGQLTSLTAPGGVRTQFGYAADGRLTSMTNPRGHTSTFEYDDDGKLIKDSDAAGGFIRLFRTGTSNDFTISETTAMGRTKSDRVQHFTDGSETRTFTTATGHKVITSRAYTGSTTTTFPDGTILRVAEGPDARFGMQAPVPASVSVRTPSGLSWSGSMSRTVTGNPVNPTSLTETSTTNGRTYVKTFDLASRVFTARTPAGRSIRGTVDEEGRTTSIVMSGAAPVTLSYEANGELAAVVTAGRASHYSYDSAGRLVSMTDWLNRTVAYEYDAAGRVVAQVLPDTRRIVFGYDANGNVVSIQPPGRSAHIFTFTSRDQGDGYQPPAVAGAAGATQYVYNLDKQLASITRADGQSVTLSYDDTGRTTSVQSATTTQAYSYFGSGRLASISAPGLTLSYLYDGPLMTRTAWSGTVTGALTWTYDSDFRVTSQAVNGTSVPFSYDSDSLLTSVGALALTWDSRGLLSGTTIAKLADSYTYNEFGEVTAYRATYDGTPILSLDYARDAGGRISSDGSRGYEYDAAGRLVRVTSGGSAVAEYSYDVNSNRTEHRWLGGTNTASYDAQDRLLRYGDTTYEYTQNGELKSKTLAGSTTTFEYDALGGLRRVVLPQGRTIDYVIDGQNRRVGKKVNGTLVQGWLYSDQLRLAAELDGSNAVVSRFLYGSHGTVPDYMIRGAVTYRIISDHLGSPRLVVNTADGTIVQRMEYDEFGRVLSDTNPGFQPFGFAGGLYDADTGLVRFGARDYDPYTGRWTTKDPILFDATGTNVYDYALGDPINNLDPSGLDAITSDPHNLEKFLDLYEKGGSGFKETERSAFVTQPPQQISGPGTANCELWPWSASNRTENWPAGKAWPNNVVAVAHTHPDKADPKPSSGDIANSNRINLPFYTVTKKGIYKYDPATQQPPTREEGPDWISRAQANRRAHNGPPKSPTCSCSQIPR